MNKNVSVFVVKRRARYFMSDLFEKDHFIEVSEQCFDDCVVRFREHYDLKYDGNKQIFTCKEDGSVFVREWLS